MPVVHAYTSQIADGGDTTLVEPSDWNNPHVVNVNLATEVTGVLKADNLPGTTVIAGAYGDAADVPTYTVDGKGRLTAAANVAIQITESQVTNLVADLAAKGTGNVSSVSVVTANGLSGTVANPTTTPAITLTLDPSAVTYAQIQNESATTLLGNPTGSAAAPSEVTIDGIALAFVGSGLQTTAFTGDVTTAPNSFATSISANAVQSSQFRQGFPDSLVGNPTSSLANVTDIELGATLAFAGTFLKSLQTTALSGDVTTAANSFSTTIAANAVGNSKFRQSAASSIVGNPTGSLANVEDITVGATLAFSGTVLETAAMTGDVTTSANSFATSIASNAVTTAKINNSAVTYAKLQNESASTLLGNPTGSAAAPSEITLGDNLAFSSTTLSALTQSVIFAGTIAPASFSTNQNNYNPTGLSTASVLYLTTTASCGLTGLVGGTDGRLITIINAGSFPLFLYNINGSSTAANQFVISKNLCLYPTQSIQLLYQGSTTSWIQVGQDEEEEGIFWGDGSDGSVTISSNSITVVLNRDMYYSNLTLTGTAGLDTNGYKIFVSQILDLSNAPVNSIRNYGGAGATATSATGGAAANTIGTANTIGAGGLGSAGANGTTTVGGNSASVATQTYSNGGSAGEGGSGGLGTSGAGGSPALGGLATNANPIRIFNTNMLFGANQISGGAGGSGGGGGGGDTTTAGGGGGGAGAGGGGIWIAARFINRGASTAAAAISSVGGAGGGGKAGLASNCGGGGGGGGAGGGWVQIYFGELIGTSASGCIAATGGVGGTGGASGGGSGVAGGGAIGGNGGNITIICPIKATVTQVIGSAGGNPTGVTGGTGGACSGTL